MFFVWVAAMMLACWAVEVARMFARRMAKEAARAAAPPPPDPDAPPPPRVAVILPIKGVDADTEANVRALLAQDYPCYRLLFAVESAADPVVPLLARVGRSLPPASPCAGVETVVAGVATARGQKIHNQLAAVARTSDADRVLVFMDADAHPSPRWLAALVRPLAEPAVGATTGFRFYVPQENGGAWRANAMVSVINAAVAALLGPGWRNMAWGGSMALRREDFFAFGVHDAWQRALSDDYVLSHCVKTRARRRIEFVQTCLVPSAAAFDWPGFWEFAARQYRITKICAPAVWLTAIGAAGLYLAALAYTLSFWVRSLVIGQPDHPLLLMFVALYLANVIRGTFLLRGGIAGLPREADRLRPAAFWYTWGYPATLAVNLLALLRSAAGRTITWRGVTYTMHSLLETTVRRPAAVPPPTPPAPGPMPARTEDPPVLQAGKK
jgi:hypothetical protein